MHPEAARLARAIRENDVDLITELLNIYENVPWIKCQYEHIPNGKTVSEEFVDSALAYALMLKQFNIVNLFLEKLCYNALFGRRTPEDRFSFHYALAYTVGTLCKNYPHPIYYFYQNPQLELTILAVSRQSWKNLAKNLAKTPEIFNQAYQEYVNIIPLVQSFIRSHELCVQMKSFFKPFEGHKNPNFTQVLKSLADLFSYMQTLSIFSEHRNFNLPFINSLRSSTHTVDMLSSLKGACDYLLKHKNFDEYSHSMAAVTNILLLCTKAFPFSPPALQQTWLALAEKLLTKFEQQPAEYLALFKPLLDKQGFYSSDNIPFVDTSLISTLPRKYFVLYFRHAQAPELENHLKNSQPLPLNSQITTGSELLAHFACPSNQKFYLYETPFNDEAKHYLHMLLMLSSNFSISYPSLDAFKQNALKLFPHINTCVYINVHTATQVIHLKRVIEVNSYTFVNMGVCLSHDLVFSSPDFSCFNQIQKILGPAQTVSILIVDNFDKRNTLTDFILSKDGIVPGPKARAEQFNRHASYQTLLNKIGTDSPPHSCSSSSSSSSTSAPHLSLASSAEFTVDPDEELAFHEADLEFELAETATKNHLT